MNLLLRPADPNDSEFAFQAKKAAFMQYVGQVWGWDEAQQRRLHEERFGAREFRIINVDGTDVGVIAVMAQPDCMDLYQLFILPRYQSRGIGTGCISLVIEEARALGMPLRLRALKVNSRAVSFYERQGFVRTGETDTHVMMEKATDGRHKR
jgi:GNAT superfamily N-acetyltransferase